jgi:hypothetical protein
MTFVNGVFFLPLCVRKKGTSVPILEGDEVSV